MNDNRNEAKRAIEKMKRFDLNKLNKLSHKYGISIYVAVHLFNSTHSTN